MLPLKGKVDYILDEKDKYGDLHSLIEKTIESYLNSLRMRTKPRRLERMINYIMINLVFRDGSLDADEPDPSTEEFRKEYLSVKELVPLDNILESSLEVNIDNIKRYIERYPENARFYQILLDRFARDWATKAEITNAVGRILVDTNRLSNLDRLRVISGRFLKEVRKRQKEDQVEELPRDVIKNILVTFMTNGNTICDFLRSSKWIYEIASEPAVTASLKQTVLEDDSGENQKLIESEYVERDDFIDWYESNFYTTSCRLSKHICIINAFYYKDYESLYAKVDLLQIETARKISTLIDSTKHEEESFLALVRFLRTKATGLAGTHINSMIGIYAKNMVENYGSCEDFLRLLSSQEESSYFNILKTQFLLRSKHRTFQGLLASGIVVYGENKFLKKLSISKTSIPKKDTLLIIQELFSNESWNLYVGMYRPFVSGVYEQLRKTRKPIYGLTLSDGWDLLTTLSPTS